MSITLKLSKSTEKRLSYLAKAAGRTEISYIHEALEEKLDEMEDIYLAEQRLIKPEGKRWGLEELEHGDDLEG